MDASPIVLQHAFGFQRKVADGLAYLDPDHIVFAAGKRIAIMGFRPKEMNFVPEYEPKLKRIVAIAVNKKHLAVSEVLDSHPQVSIINLNTMKRVATLRFSDIKEIRGMSFGNDGKSLVCFAPTTNPAQKTEGVTETAIMWWNLEKYTLTANTRINETITRISFNPWNGFQICTSGKKTLKVWKLSDGQLQGTTLLSKKDLQNYNDHCWLMENLIVVAAETGELSLIRDFELLKTYPSPFPGGMSITNLRPSVVGFLATDSSGYLAMFQKNFKESITATKNNYPAADSGEDSFLKLLKIINTGQRTSVFNAAMSPDEGNVFCLFEDSLMNSYALNWDVEASKEDTINLTNLPVQSPIHTYHFHQGAITGMDVCKRRTFLATSGADKTVHIWNYMSKSLELVKNFTEDPLCIAFHPLGFHVSIGFSTKMRQYSVLKDDLVEDHEFSLKNCVVVQYSNGGHLLAAAGGNVIIVYSTVTFDVITTIKGHSGSVKSLNWSFDDKKLVSVSSDGVMYEWSTDNWQRVEENVTKGCLYTSVIYNQNASEVIMVGNDGFIRQVASGNVQENSQGAERISSLALFYPNKSSGNSEFPLLFGGTLNGLIKIFNYPLVSSGDSQVQALREIQLHGGSLNALKVIGNNLFTCGEDGTVFMLRIFPTPTDIIYKTPIGFQELVLTTRTAIDEQKQIATELENKYKDLKSRTEYEVKLKELHFEELLKKQNMESDLRYQAETTRYDELTKEKQAQEIQNADSILALQNENAAKLKAMEEQYEAKLQGLQKRIEDLKAQKDDERFHLEEQLRSASYKHLQDTELLRQDYENKLKEEGNKLAKLQREMQYLQAEYEEELDQQEEEYEYEIAHSQERANKVIQIERDNTMTLKGDNGLLRRKYELFVSEFESLQNQVIEKDKEIGKCKRRIQDLEEVIEGLKKEVDERNFTISQKENRILEIKQKNQELEKYRFVLDYKIGELKEELNPKDLMIGDMKAQIKAMDEELQKTKRTSEQLELIINDKELRIDSMNQELKQLKITLSEKEKFIKLFVEDLHKLFTENDSSSWRAGFRLMYQTYVTGDSKRRVTKEDQERMQELARQRTYMEHSITVLKEKAIRGEERLKQDVQKKVSENANLISDLNNLRRENWDLKNKILLMENQLKSGFIKAAERVKEKDLRAIATAPALLPQLMSRPKSQQSRERSTSASSSVRKSIS